MGVNTTTNGVELAPQVVSGTFVTASHTNSSQAMFEGDFNVSLWGTFSATVELQRSFDGGTTWLAASKDSSGTAADYTSAITVIASEPEPGVYYRVACTVYTSGTVNYRLSGGQRVT